MERTAKVTISLPREMLIAADEAGAREHRTRSELMREALRWYLRIESLPVDRPTVAERKVIAVGRAEFAAGQTTSLADLVRDLEDSSSLTRR